MAKLKKLAINCNRLTRDSMYDNGRYCAVGQYLRKVKEITPQALVDDDWEVSSKEDRVLTDIMEINDNVNIPWKEKEKEINKLFKEIGVRSEFVNKWW